jgi:Hemocyanin, all-alpha domain
MGALCKRTTKKIPTPKKIQIPLNFNFRYFFRAGMKTTADFISAAIYIRDRINPGLFAYGFSIAVLHRPDTANITLPPLSETFPDKFVDGSVFVGAREEANHMEKFRVREASLPEFNILFNTISALLYKINFHLFYKN